MPERIAERVTVELRLGVDHEAALARDVRLGMTMQPKELPPKYFYDERGSRLFEQITELDEYSPTRTERAILHDRGEAITAAAADPSTRVELGSGSAPETRHLPDAMRRRECLDAYLPVDLSPEITLQTAD